MGLVFVLASTLFFGCSPETKEVVNIGFIGPLSGNADDLGLGPARAIELAVEEYNVKRLSSQPEVKLHIRDDHWDGKNAEPLYEELRREHDIDILLMSHTDGTIALQEEVERDGVILVNSLNNDSLLASLNRFTFPIGKKTEEAALVVAGRAIELRKRKIGGFHVTNNFMTIFAKAFSEEVERYGAEVEILPVDIMKTDYVEELQGFQAQGCDTLVFFGYKNLGFAMKQARDLGIDVLFLGSTTMLGGGFYENSEGALAGTEFSYFTQSDGNYVMARQFLDRYKKKFGDEPFSIWPAMQAYDAINIVLGIVGRSGENRNRQAYGDWLAQELFKVSYYQGICGNLAILEDGTSRGIYFSLYEVKGLGEVEKVRR